MRPTFLSRLAGGTTALTLTLLASSALAQQSGIALDRFDPAPAGDRFFGVQSPFAAGHLTPHVMLLLDYAHDPLVLVEVPSNGNLGAIVQSQLYGHVDASFALWNRLNFNVDVPVALYQHGSNPSGGGEDFASPNTTQFGDLRFGLRLRLAGEYHDPIQVAVGGYVWVPSGPSHQDSYVGDGEVRGLPQLIFGGRIAERVVWSAAGGPEIRRDESIAGIDMGTMFKWGAGLGFLLLDNRHLQLGAEAEGGLTPKHLQKRTTNLELIGSVRYRIVDDVEIALGAGPGLSSGVGTPDFRGLFSLAYTPEQKLDRDGDGITDDKDACPDVKGVPSADPAKNGCPPDRDGDGIIDVEDACPDVPGVKDPDPKKNGCPADRDGDGIPDKDDACPDVKGVKSDDPKKNGCPPDRDGDGIPDALDACPDVKGVADPDPKKNGCPPDRDGDGIPDAQDACPDVKGVADPDPKKNGCPPDRDGDGIPDAEDACPDVPGVRSPDPKKNGCPERAVTVTEKEILILEQVQFDTGKATIKKVSDKLLDDVAAVLKEHPEILKIEVQGHTDDRGTPASNKILSQNRANAVMKALIKRGIDKNRLVAKGYGQDKPIDTNSTDEGRQKNRRVQFIIIEKKKK